MYFDPKIESSLMDFTYHLFKKVISDVCRSKIRNWFKKHTFKLSIRFDCWSKKDTSKNTCYECSQLNLFTLNVKGHITKVYSIKRGGLKNLSGVFTGK